MKFNMGCRAFIAFITVVILQSFLQLIRASNTGIPNTGLNVTGVDTGISLSNIVVFSIGNTISYQHDALRNL